MNKKMKEMIALGVAYGINCTSCMEYHKKEAITAGLTKEEMLEAIKVAKQVVAGAAKQTEAFTKELIGQSCEEPCCPTDSECCS